MNPFNFIHTFNTGILERKAGMKVMGNNQGKKITMNKSSLSYYTITDL